ncbi:MAG: hypothetical protein ABSE73_25170 [Planctomycetota bacterium]
MEDGTFWSAKASDYMRAYFHAAFNDPTGPWTLAVREVTTGRKAECKFELQPNK